MRVSPLNVDVILGPSIVGCNDVSLMNYGANVRYLYSKQQRRLLVKVFSLLSFLSICPSCRLHIHVIIIITIVTGFVIICNYCSK